MTDHQMDSDAAPQRKRIAVACGRCRKRKIRCSGDPGQGQPCSNCKNAGAEPCQFLRVSSREAPMRHDTDFRYTVDDARLYASRSGVGAGIPYAQDLPALGSSDVLGSYRGGATYASCYTPASKAYYPAMHAYATPYGDDFEFGLGTLPSHSVLGQEPVGLLPSQWGSGARPKPPSFTSVYLDADGPYGSYSSASLVHHRHSHAVSSDAPNFSFSSVATSLPLPSTSTGGPDRLLPNPTGRPSSTLPCPVPLKPSVPAAAAGFESPGPLGYPSPTTTSSLASSHPSSSSSLLSRTNSDTYSAPPPPESIFTEQERGSLQSQGPAFDMNAYTAEPPRRGGGQAAAGGSVVGAAGQGSGGSSAVPLADGLPYGGGEHMSGGDSSSPHTRRHGQAAASGSSRNTSHHSAHDENRHHVAVASRH